MGPKQSEVKIPGFGRNFTIKVTNSFNINFIIFLFISAGQLLGGMFFNLSYYYSHALFINDKKIWIYLNKKKRGNKESLVKFKKMVICSTIILQ